MTNEKYQVVVRYAKAHRQFLERTFPEPEYDNSYRNELMFKEMQDNNYGVMDDGAYPLHSNFNNVKPEP